MSLGGIARGIGRGLRWVGRALVGVGPLATLERLGLVALGVVLETLAMPPGPAPALVFVQDAPFLWLLWHRGGRGWRRWAFYYGFARFAVGLRWLAEIHVAEIAGAAAILALTQLAFGGGVRWAARRRAPFLLAVPVAAALAEMLQTAVVWRSGMPWPARSLAYTTWTDLLGFASLFGAYGLSALGAMTSAWVSGLPALVVRSPYRADHARALAVRGLLVAVILLVATWHGGGVVGAAASRISTGETATTAPLVVVQANIPQGYKIEARLGGEGSEDASKIIFERHLALTTPALAANPGALAVLWPETMVPWPYLSAELADRFPDLWESETNVIARLKAAVPPGANSFFLLGVNHYFVGRKGPQAAFEDHDVHDSMVYVNAEAATEVPPPIDLANPRWRAPWEIGRHDKTILVPGGEYTPMGDWIPALRTFKEKLSRIPEITAGDADQQPFVLTILPPDRVRGSNRNREVRAGTIICFEVAFPARCRAWRAAGASVLLNAGNYGWYGDTGMPAQVEAISRLRAVELAATVVVAGNTGPSCIIDPAGRVRARVEVGGKTQFVEGWCAGPLYDDPTRTPYSRWGDFPWLAAGLAGILVLGIGSRLRRGRGGVAGGTPPPPPPTGIGSSPEAPEEARPPQPSLPPELRGGAPPAGDRDPGSGENL